MSDFHDDLAALAGSVQPPKTPEVDALRAAVRKRSKAAPVLVGTALVAAVLGGVIALASLRVDAERRDPISEATWANALFPSVRDGEVRFGEGRLPRPEGLVSIAATLDSALVLDGQRLIEVPASGSASRVLAAGIVGIPLGDVGGHSAVWVTQTDPEAARVITGYNTGSGQLWSLEAKKGTSFKGMPFAIHADDVYLVDEVDGRTFKWNMRSGQRVAIPTKGVVTDAIGDLTFELDFDTETSTLRRGSVVTATFNSMYFGTFSPSGTYVAMSGQPVLRIWDATDGEDVPLEMPTGWKAEQLRWSPTDELVARIVPTVSDRVSPDTPVRYVLCQLPVGSCELLPGPELPAELADGAESSSLSQFAAMVGS